MWIQEEQKMADKETEQIKKLNQTVHSRIQESAIRHITSM